MKGLHAEVRGKFHKSVENYIVVSLILQGQADLGAATAQEKRDIVARFKSDGDAAKGLATLKADEIKQKQEAAIAAQQANRVATAGGTEPTGPDEPPKTGFWETKHLSFEERKKLQAEKDAWKKRKAAEAAGATVGPSSTTPTAGFTPEDDEMERAIRESVAQTSHGDPAEDAQIEAQIRASVVEMRRIAAEKRSQQQPSRGVATSRSDAAPSQVPDRAGASSSSAAPPDVDEITDEEFEALVAEAARQSMLTAQQQSSGSALQHHGDDARGGEEEQHGVTISINDEALRQALLESQRNAATAGTGHNEELDEQLRKAIEASEREHQAQMARERSEEEIIMEYVKKQSLAEEEFRRKGKGLAGGEGSGQQEGEGEDDEELRKAMEESLRVSGRSGGPSGSA